MTRGTVRASTRGGRSVLRSAAAVEAAALRSLTLGATVPLASLGNPLERLLQEALDLSGIDQVLGRGPDAAAVRRAAGGRASSGARSATSRPAGGGGIGAAAGAGAKGVGSVAPGGIGTAARATATALQAAAGVGSSVAAALVPGAAAGASHASAAPAAGRSGPSHGGSARGGAVAGSVGRRSPGSRGARVHQPGAGDLDPDQVRAGLSTSALRRAARAGSAASSPAATGRRTPQDTDRGTDHRHAPASAADRSDDRADPTLRPALDGAASTAALPASPGTTRVAPGAPAPAAYPGSTQPARRAFTGGGLAELVARWQDGEPDALEPPVDTAPVWTPLTSTGFDRERPLRLGDEDRIELALEQILRCEVERHGLEGGR